MSSYGNPKKIGQTKYQNTKEMQKLKTLQQKERIFFGGGLSVELDMAQE